MSDAEVMERPADAPTTAPRRAIVFETPGLIDVRSFTMMGLSAKPGTRNPIGYFGTGLKYAIAVLIRLGCEPEVFIGEDRHTFKRASGEFRGVEYEGLAMEVRRAGWFRDRVERVDMPFTTSYGRNWKPWMVVRELESNTRDEGGRSFDVSDAAAVVGMPDVTRIVVDLPDAVAAWRNLGEIFLPNGQREGSGVQIIAEPSNHVYWRGLKVFDLPRPGLATYNFLEYMELTEDRTLASEWWAKYRLGQYVVACEDERAIERIVTADAKSWEHSIEYDKSVRPSIAFHAVMMRHPKGVSQGAWGYYSRYDARPETATLDPFKVHPLPWKVDGGRVYDAKGKAVFEAPYGYEGKWNVVARAILAKGLLSADEPEPATVDAAVEEEEPYPIPSTVEPPNDVEPDHILDALDENLEAAVEDDDDRVADAAAAAACDADGDVSLDEEIPY